jgi:5S rRNA maturation endonuclease (ribonuclease M5)
MTSLTADEVASHLQKAKRTGSGWAACCPAHEDRTPSLSINDGESGVVVKCHAGCSQAQVLAALEAQGIDIRRPKMNGNGVHHEEGLTVDILAAAKKLPAEFLRGNAVTDDGGRVSFAYLTTDAKPFRTKYRAALSGNRGFSMSKGEGMLPYGLWRLQEMLANDGRVILCEGETDALTLWHHGFTALGIPGSTQWRDEWADFIPESSRIIVIVEPDEGGEKFEASFKKSKIAKRVSFIHMSEETKDPNVLHVSLYDTDETAFVERFESLIKSAVPAVAQPIQPMRWSALATQTPPPREWIINQWFGMGHVTLMAGAGGLGKTSVAQVMASCISQQRDYLDDVPRPRKVLMWACEDDAEELWRRQIQVAAALNIPLKDFDDSFILMPYDGEDVELCRVTDGAMSASPMLEVLRQQIGDYGAEAVVLDNIARLYGCSENDRHQVTSFVAMLTKAAKPTRAGIMLLGHPAKAPNSEYSGSTAWEGAVRARLYLGRTLPDQEPNATQPEQQDDGIRFLCRRKANYSTRDYRRIRYCDGVMIPDEAASPVTARPTEYAQDVVVRAVVALDRMGKYGNASTSSPDYLPKLANAYNLMEGIGSKQFSTAMRELEKAGKLRMEVTGQYPNRNPKKGFRVSA